MKTTNEFLDAVKAAHNIQSDYKLGVVLGLSDSAVNNYRKGRSRLDDGVAMKVAEMLQLDPGYVVACIHAERAPDERLKRMWETLAARAVKKKRGGSTAAAVLALLMGVGVTGGPDGGAMASTLDKMSAPAGEARGALYVMSN